MLTVRPKDAPVFRGGDDLFRRVAVDQEHDRARASTGCRPVKVELEDSVAVGAVHQVALDAGACGRREDGLRGEHARIQRHQAFSPWYLPLYPSAVGAESRKNTSCATRAPRCSR